MKPEDRSTSNRVLQMLRNGADILLASIPRSELVRNNLRNTYAKAIEEADEPEQKENFRQRKAKLESAP